MEVGERSFSRGDGRSPRQSGNMIPDIEEGRYDILRVYGTEERDGRLFWSSLKSATSKAAIEPSQILLNAAKRIADCRDFDKRIAQQNTFTEAINMADELLQQVQELFEGQIVGSVQCRDFL